MHARQVLLIKLVGPSLAYRVISPSLPLLHRTVFCLNKMRWQSEKEMPAQATFTMALVMVRCGYLPRLLLGVMLRKHKVLKP